MIFLVIFIMKPGISQNAGDKKSKEEIKIKVVKDKDGKTTVLDTVITRTGAMNPAEMEEMMHSLRASMRTLEKELDQMHGNLDINMADSLEMDSLHGDFDKMMEMCREMGHGKGHGMPGCGKCPMMQEFNFGENFPDVPEFEMEGQDFDGGNFSFGTPPPPGMGMRRGEQERSGSLNDLLGSIPMERIKGYSIKENKHGKRITIDVENGPTFGPPPRTIIIRGPANHGNMRYQHGHPDKNIRVIIKTDKEDDEKEQGQAPDPEKKTKK